MAYVAMGMGMPGYDDYDSPAVVGVDGLQPVSSSVSGDSAEQTSGVDSPNLNLEATRLYSHTHTGTCIHVVMWCYALFVYIIINTVSL